MLDFREAAKWISGGLLEWKGISLAAPEGPPGGSSPFAYVLSGHPGFFFLPAAIAPEQQARLVVSSRTTYLQPPNRTNHTATHGELPDLWQRAPSEEASPPGPSPSSSAHPPAASAQPEGDVEGGGAHAPGDEGAGTGAGHYGTAARTAEGGSIGSSLQSPPGPSQSAVNAGGIGGCGSRDCVLDSMIALGEAYRGDDASGGQGEGAGAASARGDLKSPGGTASLGGGARAAGMPAARSLLRKLRWATIGLQFDWGKRAYNAALPHAAVPGEIAELAARLAAPALAPGRRFSAEAAIVNFYGPDDMLGSHQDDIEADLSKPIVSISLGCKAIFLLGGPSRSDEPVAMFLRSGDVVLMAGPARRCFHGVPRVFASGADADVPDALRAVLLAAPGTARYMEYLESSRININIREVGALSGSHC